MAGVSLFLEHPKPHAWYTGTSDLNAYWIHSTIRECDRCADLP